jgi:aspartyl protease family protein
VSGDQGAEFVFYAMALLLPLSALLARRIPLGQTLKMALAWIGIFGLGLIVVSQRGKIGGVLDDARRTLVGDDQQVVGETVRIAMAPDGHFYATVSINDISRRMLIDSGASITALSRATASAAEIDRDGVFQVAIDTANGTVLADRATAERLEIGGITAHDLPVVVADAFGQTDVIGMNFLSKLKSWRVEGRTLVLEPVGEPR